MFELIKRFFKIYPLPIFVLLVAFAIYYSIFEIIKRQDSKTKPLTEAESMLSQEDTQESNLGSLEEKLQKEIMPLLENHQTNNVEIETAEIEIDNKDINSKNNEIPNELENPKKYITSKVRSLNIRGEPSRTSPVIGKLTPQLKAIVLEDNGKWVLIGEAITQTTLGWVLKAYVTPYFSESFISQVQPNRLDDTKLNVENKQTENKKVESKQTENKKAENKQVENKQAENKKVENKEQNRLDDTKTKAENKKIDNKKVENKQATNKQTENKQQNKKKVIYYTSKVPRLNIRQKPSVDSPIVGKLTPKDTIEIIQEANGWVKIKDKNAPKGWILRKYLIEQ